MGLPLVFERDRAIALHKKQWITIKNRPEFATRIDNAIKQFSIFLNSQGLESRFIDKNNLIQAYDRYQQQNVQLRQAQIVC